MPDFIDPFEGIFLAPTVPAPDIAATGGKSTAGLPQDLIPKPAPASSIVPVSPVPSSPVTPGAPPAQTPFVDPFESGRSQFVDPFEKTTTPAKPLGDLLLPRQVPFIPPVEKIPPITPMPGSITRSQVSIAEPQSRGWFGDIGSALTRAFIVRTPELIGNVSEDIGRMSGSDFFKNIGNAITEFTNEAPKKYPFLAPSKEEATSLFRRGIMSALESGVMAAPIMVLGGIPGAIIGLGVFGLGAHQQAYKQAIAEGKTEDEANSVAWKVGLINGGIMAAMGPLGRVAGGIGRGAAAPIEETIRSLLAPKFGSMSLEAATQAGLMMGQSVAESQILQNAGMQTPGVGEALKESALPSIGMSILFGLATHGMARIKRNQMFEALNKPGMPIDDRLAVLDSITNELNSRYQGTQDQGLGDLWKQKATEYLDNGKPIPIDENFMGFLNGKFRYDTAISEATKKQAEEALAKPISTGETEVKGLLAQSPDWVSPTIGKEVKPTPTPEAMPPKAPGGEPSPVPPSPAPTLPGTLTPPGLVSAKSTPEVNKPPVTGPNLPPEGTLGKPPVSTPSVTPEAKATPSPAQATPEKAPVPANIPVEAKAGKEIPTVAKNAQVEGPHPEAYDANIGMAKAMERPGRTFKNLPTKEQFNEAWKSKAEDQGPTDVMRDLLLKMNPEKSGKIQESLLPVMPEEKGMPLPEWEKANLGKKAKNITPEEADRRAALLQEKLKNRPPQEGPVLNPENRAKLQNELLDLGRKGPEETRRALEDIQANDPAHLKALADANRQPTDIEKLTNAATRAAQNVGRVVGTEPTGQTPKETPLPKSWQDTLLPDHSYRASDALNFLRNAPETPPDVRMLLNDLYLRHNGEIQSMPVVTIDPNQTEWRRPGSSAYYTYPEDQPGKGNISLNTEMMRGKTPEGASRTMLEEILHGLLEKRMTAGEKVISDPDPKVQKLIDSFYEKENYPTKDQLDLLKMMDWAKDHLPAGEKETLDIGAFENYSVGKLQEAGLSHPGQVYYALSDPSEFIANSRRPEVREFLQSIPAMEGSKQTLWDRFIDWVNRVLFGKKDNRNLLSQVLGKSEEIMGRESPEAGKLAENTPKVPPSEIPAEKPQAPKMPDIGANAPPRHMGKLIQETKMARIKYLGTIDEAKIPQEMKDYIESMSDPAVSNKAASDSRFKVWINKKLGLLPITNKDMTLAEQYLSLPVYLKQKYPIFDKLLDIQTIGREEPRSQIIHDYNKMAEPFMILKDKNELAKVDKALIEGDKEHVVYDNATLKGEKFGLSDRGIEAYNSVRDTLNHLLQRWIDHSEWAILHRFEDKLNAEEFDQLRNIYQEKLTPEDLANLPENVRKAYDQVQPGVNLIKDFRSRIGELAGYFPHWRQEGKFYVSVMEPVLDKQGNPVMGKDGKPQQRPVYTKFFNSSRAAQKKKTELESVKKPNEEVVGDVHKKELETSYWGTSDKNMQRLIDNSISSVKEHGGMTDEQANDLRSSLANSLADTLMARGASARMIKRAKYPIEGYQTTDLKQVLQNYITGYAGMETKQDAAYEFMKALSDIPEKQSRTFQEASHYVDGMLRNYDNMDKWFAKMKALAFTYYLSASIRAGVVNATQNFITGIPFLAREMRGIKKGVLGAERSMIKSMWDVATGNFRSEEERMMDHELLSRGITNDQNMRQISREVAGTLTGTMGKVAEIMAYPFSQVEIFNRRAAARAAFRTFREKGQNYEEAINSTRDFINNTHYLMTKANVPHSMRGEDLASKLMATGYVFRRFNHNFILSMINSLRGDDGRFHMSNIDVLMRSMAWITVLGGVTSIPFLDDLLDEGEKFFGVPYRQQVRQGMRSLGGEALERAGISGIPAMLGQIPGMVGVDLSGSLKIGMPFVGTPSESIFGVWSGLGKKAVNAYQSIGRDDYLRAVESASPVFLENILKAMRMNQMGATTPSGKILYDEKGQPIKETGGEAAAQIMGFRPERIARLSEQHREFRNIEANFTKRLNNLYDRFKLSKDTAERAEIIKDIQKYNLDAIKYRGAIPLINAESLRRSFTQKPEKKYLLWGTQS